jgi:outer membrane protein assembly factor BamB
MSVGITRTSRTISSSEILGASGQYMAVLASASQAVRPRPRGPGSVGMVLIGADASCSPEWVCNESCPRGRGRTACTTLFTAAKTSFFVLVVLLASATATFAQSSAQDYPQWRGQNRDGAASGFTAPKVWPEKLTRRWKVEVGEGYATPLVVGKTVYAFTRRADKEVLLALDAATGKLVWQTGYPAPPLAPGSVASAHGNGPKATPLFHRGKFYTLGLSGTLTAFDAATGKLLWQQPAPAEPPYYGMAVSPVGDKDLVIVHAGSHGPLTAFDANTGTVKWTAPGDSAWASPSIVELGGTRQVVSMTQKSVISVALADGTLLWEHPCKSSGTASTMTPIVYGDTLIIASQKMPVAALKPARRDDKWVVEVVWENKEVSLFMSNPVLIRDTLFGLSERSSGQFFALDAKTGKTLWLGQPREATNTAVVKAGELLFLLNDDAELIVARSSQTGFEPLKRYTVADSATWAQPAISGKRVFVKDVTSLALWTLN